MTEITTYLFKILFTFASSTISYKSSYLHLLILTRMLLPQLMPATSGNLTSFIVLMRIRSYHKNGIIMRVVFASTGYDCVPRLKSQRAVNFTQVTRTRYSRQCCGGNICLRVSILLVLAGDVQIPRN